MIALTLGDAAGIGPEIILKALKSFITEDFLIYGDTRILEKENRTLGFDYIFNAVSDVSQCVKGMVNVMDLHNLPPSDFTMGEESALCGRAAYEYIEKAVKDALEGKVECVCTAPINKVSLRMAGVPYIGHTEIFASLTGTDDPLTMFQVENMRIFFLSRHVSLRKACDMVTYQRLMDYIPRCMKELERLDVRGTFAVAGLNPHSSDGGLFGDEEKEIERAVDECRRMGLDVAGPVSADSVFHQCLKGKYSAVLSLYHDQGHIAAKTYNFDKTISLTLGMPVLRISVDHGTAFDIAGCGIADETGMKETLSCALRCRPAFLR